MLAPHLSDVYLDEFQFVFMNLFVLLILLLEFIYLFSRRMHYTANEPVRRIDVNKQKNRPTMRRGREMSASIFNAEYRIRKQ